MNRNRESNRLRRRYMAAVVLVSALLILLLPFAERAERTTTDLWFALRGAREPTGNVVLVTIDDESFDAIDLRWPWPRDLIARGLEAIDRAGARAIGVDIAMSERGFTPENDQALAAAISNGAPVVLPEKFEIQQTSAFQRLMLVEPRALFRDAGARTGYVNLVEDRDGRVRRVLLSQPHSGVLHLPFFVETLAAGNGVAGAEGLARVRATYGRTFLIPYLGPAGTLPRLSFHSLLDGSADLSLLRDAYVLIGATFKEAHDDAPTPFFSGIPTPGVEIHGQALDAVLAERTLVAVPPAVNLVLLLAAAIFAYAILQRARPAPGALVVLAAAALLFGVGALLFSSGTVIRVVAPIAMIVLVYVGSVGFHYVVEERQGRYVRSLFSRYVAPAVVGQILADPSAVELGGELRDVTLFFSDIRSFTHLSEGKSPQTVVHLLNEYFDAMTEIIFDHGGTVNKFIGDAIMAFYGAPIEQDDAAERAVLACLDMRARLADLNGVWGERGEDQLRIGMALHCGDVLLGNIGSKRQMEYTVIGDAVNVCSRIESMTKELKTDLLISDAVYERVRSLVAVKTHADVPIRGRDQTIVLHSVVGALEEGGES